MEKLKINNDVENFLRQSNYIEREYSEEAFNDANLAWNHAFKYRGSYTTKYILRIHEILMSNLNSDIAGKFRQCDVYIGGEKRAFISDEVLLNKLKAFIRRFKVKDIMANNNDEEMDEIIKQRHIEFEKIHPFVDGNGRVGRILMNIERFRLKLPILIIHEGKEQLEYYKWFKEGGEKE